eukprot:401170-Amphidinium_carterae.1
MPKHGKNGKWETTRLSGFGGLIVLVFTVSQQLFAHLFKRQICQDTKLKKHQTKKGQIDLLDSSCQFCASVLPDGGCNAKRHTFNVQERETGASSAKSFKLQHALLKLSEIRSTLLPFIRSKAWEKTPNKRSDIHCNSQIETS